MSNQYWAKRIADTQNKVANKSINDINKQLSKYYKKTMESVVSDFEATYDKLLANAKDGKVLPNDLYQLDRYWKMQNQLQEKLQTLGDKQSVLFGNQFKKTYKDIYYSIPLQSSNAFSQTNFQNAQQVINTIWCADGKNWSSRIWDNTSKLQETLNDELIKCVAGGKTTKDLTGLLQERFGVSYHRASTITRTEITHIQTQAAADRYKDAGCDEYQILVNPDERTCDVCASFDGQIYKMSEMVIGVNAPPFHTNCRDTIIPIIKERD